MSKVKFVDILPKLANAAALIITEPLCTEACSSIPRKHRTVISIQARSLLDLFLGRGCGHLAGNGDNTLHYHVLHLNLRPHIRLGMIRNSQRPTVVTPACQPTQKSIRASPNCSNCAFLDLSDYFDRILPRADGSSLKPAIGEGMDEVPDIIVIRSLR